TVDVSQSGGDVDMKWGESARATRYHMQVSTDAAFVAMSADAVLAPGIRAYKFRPVADGVIFWRVAGVDDKGREGEYGFPRKFSALNVGKPLAEKPVELKIDPFSVVAKAGGGLLRQGKTDKDYKKVAGKFTMHGGDMVKAESAGSVNIGSLSG